MRSGFLPARVVHIHPTTVCNLACAHCYSSSSPQAGSSLDCADLLAALQELRKEGYEVLSVSGGEPLVYRDLRKLLHGSADLGYRNHVVTNGLLLTRERLASLKDCVQLIAVSFDGAREVHNQVRGRPNAFDRANQALDVLGSGSVPFAMAFGVSRYSLPDVPWAYERALESGASVLQLRPLVSTGRARHLEDDWFLTPVDCARLVVLGSVFGPTSADELRVQVDLVPVVELATAAGQFLSPPSICADELLSDFVNPIVIRDTGALVPFTYDIDPDYTVANVARAVGPSIAAFKQDGAGRIADLIEAALQMAADHPGDFLDWFAHLTATSMNFPRRLAGAAAASS